LALANLDRNLSARLHRIGCPAPEELGEYHLQLLADDRAREIRRHVADCRQCAQELAGLRDYLADLRPDIEQGPFEAVGARARVWLARLAGGTWGPGPALQPAPAVAGVRGTDQGPRVYNAGDMQVSIDVQSDPSQPGQRCVYGLLLASEPEKYQAHLWQEGKRITSVPVVSAGSFVISGLEPAGYELILEGPDAEVHVQDLTVE
jgi:hypothetical protein